MATGKRYYWIKLRDNFFDDDGPADYLMSQPNGANYVVLYQMLCLKTINTNGRLSNKIGEILIPYDIEKIRRTCKYFTSDTIRVAMNLYGVLGLIYEDREGVLTIADFKNMVGSETSWKEQKRAQRAKRLPPLSECKRLNADTLLLPSGKTQYVDEKRYGGNGMLAFDLAGGRCEKCGATEDLLIHHANGYSNASQDLFVLCQSCHGKAHSSDVPDGWLHHSWTPGQPGGQEGGQPGGQTGGQQGGQTGGQQGGQEGGQKGGQEGGQEGGHVHPRDKEIKRLESSTLGVNNNINKNNNTGRNKSVSQDARVRAREDGRTDDELQEILDHCELKIFPASVQAIFIDSIERMWYSRELKVDKSLMPQERVRSRLHQLDSSILQQVRHKLETNQTPIKNPTAYIMALIYTEIIEAESSVAIDPYLNSLTTEVT